MICCTSRGGRAFFIRAALVGAIAHSGALAAIDHPEIEPNDTKAAATFVLVADGDTLSGVTTGASTTTPGPTSADYFHLKTLPRTLGIYRHRLVITTSGGLGHTGTLRGLNQSGTISAGGTIGTTDSTVQSSSMTTVPPRYCQWYGFGREEEINFRIAGTSVTTGPYSAVHEETPVAPIEFSGVIEAGSVTIDRAASNSNDTDFWVYGSDLRPIPFAGRDDGSPSSILTLTLAPGTYYLALSSYNLANNQPSGPGETFFGPVLEFPDAVANSLLATYPDLNMRVTSVAGTVETANVAKTEPFQVLFIRFTVLDTVTPSGACCMAAGACATLAQPQCQTAGGDYRGDGTACSPNPCSQPGACCFGQCCVVVPPSGCHGSYRGDGTSCTADAVCPDTPMNDRCENAIPIIPDRPLVSANCGATRDSAEVAPRCSSSFGATLWFMFTPPFTAHYRVTTCGASFDSLLDVLESSDCAAFTPVACNDDACMGGEGEPGPLGAGSAAASDIAAVQLEGGRNYLVRVGGFGLSTGVFPLLVTPNPAAGACCNITTGLCRVSATGFDGCNTGETFVGGLCSPSPCAQPLGACCRGSTCVPTQPAECGAANQQFSGIGTVCNAAGSTNGPCCLADFNHAGGVSVQDIFDFLAGYFAADAGADINGGGLSVQDIFDFLAAFFAAGC